MDSQTASAGCISVTVRPRRNRAGRFGSVLPERECPAVSSVGDQTGGRRAQGMRRDSRRAFTRNAPAFEAAMRTERKFSCGRGDIRIGEIELLGDVGDHLCRHAERIGQEDRK